VTGIPTATHACGAHVVVTGDRVVAHRAVQRPLRFALAQPGVCFDGAPVEALELGADRVAQHRDAALVLLAQSPLESRPRHAQAVSLGAQPHATIRIGRLLTACDQKQPAPTEAELHRPPYIVGEPVHGGVETLGGVVKRQTG